MRKALTAAMAAITFTGATLAAVAPAEAQPRYRGDYYRHDRDRNRTGTAVAAGVVGLALGAALAGSGNNRGYYNNGYYGGGRAYYRERPYRICEGRRWVYDPYIGRRVMIRDRFPC